MRGSLTAVVRSSTVGTRSGSALLHGLAQDPVVIRIADHSARSKDHVCFRAAASESAH